MNRLNILLKFSLLFSLLTVGTSTYASSAYSPSHIKKFIVEEANKQGVDPALALAIAKVESNFNSDALSSAGAKGIMQIMPATAEKEFGISRYRLFNAKTNIWLGIRFIKKLLNAYDQRVDIALSHYNGGSAVRGKHGRLSVIPATKGYVRKVLVAREQFDNVVHQLSTKPALLANGATSNFERDGEIHVKRVAALDDFSPLSYRHKIAETEISGSIENKHYTRLENLQRLRLHNIERNFKMISNTQAIVAKKRLIHQSLASHQGKNTPQLLSVNSKRQKVLKWEKIFK
jgi:hypothetical protein